MSNCIVHCTECVAGVEQYNNERISSTQVASVYLVYIDETIQTTCVAYSSTVQYSNSQSSPSVVFHLRIPCAQRQRVCAIRLHAYQKVGECGSAGACSSGPSCLHMPGHPRLGLSYFDCMTCIGLVEHWVYAHGS